ncbi:Rho-binding antiterminator [Paraglaciecola sp. 20A4]|uniref:Rho-binding antiterminator n=1 Tax=Paraglaciecola sp. 20A4 TaxID=2687288 RepID=UPI0014090B6A|nr:Rho-binding antiterminator [Paraglaciecola sp. 20A4]
MKCAQQDYIEIACLYHLPITLTLKDDQYVTGVAINTGYNALRQECVLIDTVDGNISITLDTIQTMHALVTNPHFTLVNFSD